jgi:hypothetical protein
MGKRSRSVRERKTRSEVIAPGVLAFSNEKITPEKLQHPDTMIFDLIEVHKDFILSALPRFTSEKEAFACAFSKEGNAFGHFQKSNFVSALKNIYSTFTLKQDNIFEFKVKENSLVPVPSGVQDTYWLGVLQPTKPYDIQRAEICISSMVCGVEVNGQGFLFKRKEDVYQVKDFLDNKIDHL